MLTELAALETQNRKAAHRDFVAAVWEGALPSQLLPLARAAGLAGDEADALIERICQAKEQIDHVNRLGRLRKDAAAAQANLDKVQARANAEIAKLESQMRDAAYEAEAAQKATNEADGSSRQLLAMYDEGLLPATEAPRDVLNLVERRDAEAQVIKLDQARVAAFDERNRRRAIVHNIQERLANLPITRTSPTDESMLEDRLKEAKRQLADAESRLKKAEAVAEAARRAIP